jgi:uncharacterized membrane protein
VSRRFVQWTFAALYAGVGVVYLVSPDLIVPIVPAWVPRPREVVLVTGACEIAGALGLLIPRLRPFAGVMLALYAACVFPANVKHAAEGLEIAGLPTRWWYHGPRLALQPVLILAAVWAARVIDWPFGRAGTGARSRETSR